MTHDADGRDAATDVEHEFASHKTETYVNTTASEHYNKLFSRSQCLLLIFISSIPSFTHFSSCEALLFLLVPALQTWTKKTKSMQPQQKLTWAIWLRRPTDPSNARAISSHTAGCTYAVTWIHNNPSSAISAIPLQVPILAQQHA